MDPHMHGQLAHNKVQRQFSEEKITFSTKVLRYSDIFTLKTKKKIFDSDLKVYTQINSKCIIDFSVKQKQISKRKHRR